MYWAHHYWGMHMFWWIFWLALVIALMLWAWPTAARRRDSAIEQLRRAYASGQISEDEYRHKLAILTERPPGESPRPAA
jgi:putative membrane protein